MITKFKLFETLNEGEPEVGDYVIVDMYNSDSDNIIKDFRSNSIGLIWKKEDDDFLYIKYFNIPKNILKYFYFSDYSDGLNIGNSIFINKKWIKYWSKDKEELEPIISAKKYNL